MKKVSLMMAAAVIIAVGSAFTTAGGGEEYVETSPGVYELKIDVEGITGHCYEGATVCTLILREDAEEPLGPEDFDNGDSDMVWVPNP